MLKLDRGFCCPVLLRLKKYSDLQESGDEEQGEYDIDKEREAFSDNNVIRTPLYFTRYWPSKEHRALWNDYLQMECIINDQETLNALFLSAKILQANNLYFIEAQT
jgi:hypothetical protein